MHSKTPLDFITLKSRQKGENTAKLKIDVYILTGTHYLWIYFTANFCMLSIILTLFLSSLEENFGH